MNKLIIVGNLTNDPESRIVDTANGQQMVCSFTVATNRRVKEQRIAEYFRISCWNRQAENAVKYLAKGSKVWVSGPVTVHAYIANDGTARASLEISSPEEIEYLSSSRDGGERGAEPTQAASWQPVPEMDADGFMHIPDGIDDELPFH